MAVSGRWRRVASRLGAPVERGGREGGRGRRRDLCGRRQRPSSADLGRSRRLRASHAGRLRQSAAVTPSVAPRGSREPRTACRPVPPAPPGDCGPAQMRAHACRAPVARASWCLERSPERWHGAQRQPRCLLGGCSRAPICFAWRDCDPTGPRRASVTTVRATVGPTGLHSPPQWISLLFVGSEWAVRQRVPVSVQCHACRAGDSRPRRRDATRRRVAAAHNRAALAPLPLSRALRAHAPTRRRPLVTFPTSD